MTCVDTFDDIAEGILHITTYRVIFAGSHVQVCCFEQGHPYVYAMVKSGECFLFSHCQCQKSVFNLGSSKFVTTCF